MVPFLVQKLATGFARFVKNLRISTVTTIRVKDLANFVLIDLLFVYNVRFLTAFSKCGFRNVMVDKTQDFGHLGDNFITLCHFLSFLNFSCSCVCEIFHVFYITFCSEVNIFILFVRKIS